jgi:catechol 2,3-dioxygenase-like lactoylglutathione lyase family enzyme
VLDHVSIGVRDLAASRRFYDAALAPLGYRCLTATADQAGYGRDTAVFWIGSSPSPVPPDPESGLHFCFTAESRRAVDAFHAASIKAGGTDNGAPGLRPQYSDAYYAAFVHDPDGYRLEAHCGLSA